MLNDVLAITPLTVLVIAAALVLLLSVAGGENRPAPTHANHLAFLALIALSFSGWLLWKHESDAAVFSGRVLLDGISSVFGFISIVGAALCLLFAVAYLKEHRLAVGEFIGLLLLSTVGMLVMITAGDLLNLFIGIETMSLAIYVLAGYLRHSKLSQEAAMKYFLYGAFASAFALFGIALLYGECGRISGEASIVYANIASAFKSAQPSLLGWIGITMVIGGLGFKVAAVPFHMWAPDVYEGAPTPVSAFMAVGVKAASFAALIRFVDITILSQGKPGESIIQAFELLAIITMLTGNLIAIRQTQIKRMLAYSSIAHAGYIFVGLSAWLAQPSHEAISGIAYYLCGYTFMTVGAFGVLIALEHRGQTKRNLAMDDLSGYGIAQPFLGICMSIFMLGLAGIPPSVGFFGKLAMFGAAVDAGRTPLVIIAVLASAVGAYYYLRIIVVMFMQPLQGKVQTVESTWLKAGLWTCSFLTLYVGTLPETYFSMVKSLLKSWL